MKLALLVIMAVAFVQESGIAAPRKKAKRTKKPKPLLKMAVTTRTGNINKNSKVDQSRIYILLNGDTKHKIRIKNRNQDNFESGATDHFKNLPVYLPLEKIESIRVEIEGADMWKCESIQFQFFKDDQKSPVYRFSPHRYMSSGKERAIYRAVRFLDFRLHPQWEEAAAEKEKDQPKESR